MAVLVTGATGFLGGRLAGVLAARGESVRILARPGRDLRHLEPHRIEVVLGTLSDTEALAWAVDGVTHIYNCAGCSTDWAPYETFHTANVAGVSNLIRAAARVRELARLVHVSTTDIYGYPLQPCDETHPARDIGLSYNKTKCLGEQEVWRAHDAGLPVTVVRPATIYGPRGTVFATEIAAHLKRGTMAVIDGGRASGGFCYVDNCVDAMMRAAASPIATGRAYNIADGTGASWRTYVDMLAARLSLRRAWINLPARVAFSLAQMMETVYGGARIASRPPLTRHAVYLLSRNQEFPAARAGADFGFNPAISFDEGVERTARWLRDGDS